VNRSPEQFVAWGKRPKEDPFDESIVHSFYNVEDNITACNALQSSALSALPIVVTVSLRLYDFLLVHYGKHAIPCCHTIDKGTRT